MDLLIVLILIYNNILLLIYIHIYIIEWSCLNMVFKNECTDSDGTVIDMSVHTSKIIIIPAGTLSAYNTYQFTFTGTKSSRTGSSSAVIVISENCNFIIIIKIKYIIKDYIFIIIIINIIVVPNYDIGVP